MAIHDDATSTGLTPDAVAGEQPRSESDSSSQADDRGSVAPAAAGEAPTTSVTRTATWAGAVMVLLLGSLIAWLGFSAHQTHRTSLQRNAFLQVGKQGAINLTSIDFQHAEADVQRILDSAAGVFYDDFSQRSQPFVDIVKKTQSKSVGTITEAGIESETADEAQVLVAVGVKTTNVATAEPRERSWRMRISVSRIGDEVKVSNVAFVP
ncbi:MAG: mammalian cell entry protein [Mycolicibacter algericus]|uniref:mammalian cell entry protein n=1 Tax=Mycolicibacter algericus TaxID=1288388 RepID=UPI003C71DE4F